MFKYSRIKVFYALLKPFSKRQRARRMSLFVKIMKPTPNMRVLDLGGEPEIWDYVDVPLHITCLNLPGFGKKNHQTHHQIHYVEGDACCMPQFQPGDFDLIFSNSVIEHVGDHNRRLQFGNEVLRLSTRYWIQTPSKLFPIEAHSGMPFWWFYPQSLRSYFLNEWRKKLPYWTSMVAGTVVVTSDELRDILPGCKIKYELFLGLPKSIIAYLVD